MKLELLWEINKQKIFPSRSVPLRSRFALRKHFLLIFITSIISLIFSLSAFAQKNPLSQIQEELQVGGGDAPQLTIKTETPRCEQVSISEGYKIIFNTLSGSKCQIKIPLQKDLSQTALLAFRIRGERDVQNFNVGLEADGKTGFVGAILEYLPFSVISSWKQTGIPIENFKAKELNISRAQNFILDFNEPAEGVVEIKDIVTVPRKPNTQNWEVLLFSLSDHKLQKVSDFNTLSLGHFGQEFGWKVGQVYRTLPPRSLAGLSMHPSRFKSKTPPVRDGYLKIADFDRGLENSLNGYFNEFQKEPSTTFVTLNSQIFRGKAGRSFEITYVKKAEGFCGTWVHFFDFKKPPLERVYLDATPFHYFSFWVRGEQGKEDAAIQLADAGWEMMEDSVYYGKISDYLKGGVTSDWRQVIIPLKKDFYKNINFKKLASVTINFREVSRGKIFIDDIAFLTKKDVFVPETQSLPQETVLSDKKLYKAIWIWHTMLQLKNTKAQDTFFKFCKEEGVNLVFFQLQYQLQRKPNGKTIFIFKEEKELRKFIAKASSFNIEIHALDGFSRFALRPWHEKIYAQIQALIDYNKRVFPNERFTGIHHDNEPYLIPSYWGFILEDAMTQYLELCEKSQKMVHESGLANFVYGVDIPFWYEEANFDFDIPVEITWKGKRKPASFHVIDIVDNVGIMDYRTKAFNADGTIVHGRDEIYYANSKGKKILVGLETYPLPHEIFSVFRGNQHLQLTELEEKIRHNPRQLFMIPDQYQDLGVLYMRRFRDDLKDTPEKMEKELRKLKMENSYTILKAEVSVDVPSSKLSFAGMDKEYFLEIYESTKNYFLKEPSFAGMAIHYYETYKELMRE